MSRSTQIATQQVLAASQRLGEPGSPFEMLTGLPHPGPDAGPAECAAWHRSAAQHLFPLVEEPVSPALAVAALLTAGRSDVSADDQQEIATAIERAVASILEERRSITRPDERLATVTTLRNLSPKEEAAVQEIREAVAEAFEHGRVVDLDEVSCWPEMGGEGVA